VRELPGPSEAFGQVRGTLLNATNGAFAESEQKIVYTEALRVARSQLTCNTNKKWTKNDPMDEKKLFAAANTRLLEK
jgi:hypothetical protein